MSRALKPALLLGVPAGAESVSFASAEERAASRIRAILETRPGQMPWRPDFGCALDDLVGKPATPGNIDAAKSAIRHSITKWAPDLMIRRLDVRAVPVEGLSGNLRLPTVPLGETALLSLGAQARMEVRLEVDVPGHSFAVRTAVTV